MTQTAPRVSDHPISPAILARWSPRAFDDSAIDEATLLSLIEAARWAPSAYNAQPWRFVYGLRGTEAFDALVSALLPFNAAWAEKAGALLYVLSDTLITPPGKTEPVPSGTHAFDAGAAWGYFALQATLHGLHTHAMAGFDPAKAAEVIGSGARYQIHAAVAVGRIGDPNALPEGLRAREVPSDRRPLAEIALHGRID